MSEAKIKQPIGAARKALIRTASLALFLCVAFCANVVLGAEVPNPYPRPLLRTVRATEWDFQKNTEGWRSQNNTEISTKEGALTIRCTGEDPYIVNPSLRVKGPILATIRLRGGGSDSGRFYWTTEAAPHMDERKAASFPLKHDGQWREYVVEMPVEGKLTQLRLDPGNGPGQIDVDWIRLERSEYHPLEISEIRLGPDGATATARNLGETKATFKFDGSTKELLPNESIQLQRPFLKKTPFETVAFDLTPQQPATLPPLSRAVVAYHPESKITDWVSLKRSDLEIQVSPDGAGARVLRKGKAVAILAPLISRGGVPLPTKVALKGSTVLCEGPGGERLRLTLSACEARFRLEADRETEGPAVRALGTLEQGLLSGVEHLGRGERSSSELDLRGPRSLRFAPDKMWVTMPLMAFVTDRASIAMSWSDMELQPLFATPNFFDGAADHRMSLRGRAIDATIRIAPSFGEGERLADAILWQMKRQKLPPLPEAPRTEEEQFALCMRALEGNLRTNEGWGHCAEDRWKRQFFAGHVSTIWRITGQAPATPKLVGGGVHVPNPAAYFVTGRAKQWLNQLTSQARSAARQQKSDGSFRYAGKFAEGHFEDTASGFCAKPAWTLLRHAAYTGDDASLQAGLRALEYMKRFRTPRGGQVWEIPLHTPDILGSAFLVWSYTLGYELTGKEEYLALARRWAIGGLPFVYMWGNRPTMTYSTIAVLGATNWQAPVWIGLPVQWCGLDYAYALLDLAKHDKTLDWRKVAEGILIAGERMQYPDGPHVGCLPDSLELASQTRRPWDINPCVLVALRLRLAGRIDGVDLAIDGDRRVVAPFPVRIDGDRALIQGQRGVRYQVVLNGSRVVNIISQGEDTIPLGKSD